MRYCRLPSPLGTLLLAGDDQGLQILHFEQPGRSWPVPPEWEENEKGFAPAARQLAAYFLGKLRDFDLPLAPQGTPFQLSVWKALCRIPYGETRSYLDIAEKLGAPRAVRAVGAANGRNPIAIVIPCHRVIGSNGSLTGYGGGIEIKARLLALEGAAAAPRGQLSLLTNLH
jgi:methylated-DNA-[protein]-cysteine S-methyltransferase